MQQLDSELREEVGNMTESATEPMVATAPGELDQSRQSAKSNFGLAAAAGLIAAGVGAILWAVVAYVTQMELGIVAIVVGAIVGIAIRRVGGGGDSRYGFLGAACAALGWALGTVLCDLAFLANQTEQPFVDVVGRVGLGGSIPLAIQSSDAMDLLFLAIAVWEGYKFSTRRR
jgi:hypothetical protein